MKSGSQSKNSTPLNSRILVSSRIQVRGRKPAGEKQRLKAAKQRAKQAAAKQKKLSKRLDRFGTAFLAAIVLTSGLIEVKEELDRRKKNGE